jgi:formylglycine-generating enzyme required for sulfatase activity
VGVTFLEETFAASSAPPQHRLHQKAARAVLAALLPEAGTDIKGHMRSEQELRVASGYDRRPQDFDELLHILDSELRLITPTDPAGIEAESATPRPVAEARYSQLTHDYLVPSLRDWLTRKQKETRRGRAELLLADRAAVWNARPENRELPSLWQWLQVRCLTAPRNWTPPQRKMMHTASRYQAVRGVVLAVGLVALSALGWMVRNQVREQSDKHHAAGLVQRLLDAETPQVPAIVAEMGGYRTWTDPLLRDEYQKAKPRSRRQLHASLALVPADASQLEYLYGRLLDAEPHEVPVIRDALAAHLPELVDRLWAEVEQRAKGKEQHRLRAAAALALYDQDSRRWSSAGEAVANDLVSVPAVYLATWLESFRPVRQKLLQPLGLVFRDPKRRETERSLATDILADYASDRPADLLDLLLDADAKQFAVLYPRFRQQAEGDTSPLAREVDRELPAGALEVRERLAKRQANAAVTLLKMEPSAKVWPLLRHSSDPRVRSYLIHRFGPLGVDADVLVKRLQEEPDVTIRRALILSLGPEEYGPATWTPEGRKQLVEQLQAIYRTAADPGLHAAAEWLLRQWGEGSWLVQTNAAWVKDHEQREKRLQEIRQEAAEAKARPQWYVNGQGQRMVVIPGPVEFVMGSPTTEPGRMWPEEQHRRRIGRTFAIAAKPVTVAQYLQFRKHGYIKEYAPSVDCPMHGFDWYEAAGYCNWLSDREGIAKQEWCYETDSEGRATKARPNYLSRTGYRLPSEAEVEYACRANAVTSRCYGESEELLGKYACFLHNAADRSWPVGSKKPNDLGFFDMHGNVLCWCQETYKRYPQAKEGQAVEDQEDVLTMEPASHSSRALRGGSFGSHAGVVRSAYRVGNAPSSEDYYVGLRPARTLR